MPEQEERKPKRLNQYIPFELWQRINHQRIRRGISQRAWVEDALTAEVERQEADEERGRRR